MLCMQNSRKLDKINMQSETSNFVPLDQTYHFNFVLSCTSLSKNDLYNFKSGRGNHVTDIEALLKTDLCAKCSFLEQEAFEERLENE